MKLVFNESLPDKNWVVLHTRSRREKKVADFCLRQNIPHYLPLEHRYKMYGRKRVMTSLPLFPGYVFSYCNNNDCYDLLMSHQLARVLKVADESALLQDLKQLYVAQDAGLNLKPSQYFFHGQKIRIISGPLTGFEGIVQNTTGRQRLVLNVDFIQQAATVDIENYRIVAVS